MHVADHDSIESLQQLRGRKSHQAIAMRLQIIVLAGQRHTALQIAQAVGLSRRQVQDWVRRYNQEGVAGLYDRPRPGQPTKLSPQQHEQLKQRVLAGPNESDGGVCTLRGKDVQRILRDEFGVQHSLSGVYQLLHRLGLSCLKPRPRHRKNDKQAMKQWLNDAPLFSSKFSGETQIDVLKSGSKTKQESANKDR